MKQENKKKLAKEITNLYTDMNTGEIQAETTFQEFYVNNEPEYIKLYLEHICSFNGLKQGFSPILLKFCSYIRYPKEQDKHQIIHIDRTMKEEIANELEITVKRVEQALTEFIKADIFKKIFDEKTKKFRRSAYIVNPYLIGKGSWNKIRDFRATFDYMNKTIETFISVEKEVEKESETETKKEVEKESETITKPRIVKIPGIKHPGIETILK